MPSVTLVGDAMSGKTHALLNLAAAEAVAGRTVVYVANLQADAVQAFQRYVRWHADDDTVVQAYRASGKERVLHEGGGSVRFWGVGRWGSRDLATTDVLLLDGLTDYHLCTDPLVGYPNIRVYRTSL